MRTATPAKTILFAAAIAVALPTASLLAQDNSNNSGMDDTGQTVIQGQEAPGTAGSARDPNAMPNQKGRQGQMQGSAQDDMEMRQMSPDQKMMMAKGFFEAQASANQFEIEAAKYAEQHSDNPDVKQIAQTIAKDHTGALKVLRQQAKECGVNIAETPKLNDVNKDELEMTKKMPKGVEFDQGYIYSQDAAHLKVALLLSHAEKMGPNPQVQAYASQVLPKVMEHHATLHTLANQMSGYNPDGAMTARGQMNPNEGMDSQMQKMSKQEMDKAVEEYFKHAAEGAEYELQTAKLAVSRTQKQDVKQVAQTILDDHERSNQMLKQQAKAAGVNLGEQTKLSDLLSDKMAMLKEKQGGDFDRAYIFDLAAGHRMALLADGDARTELKGSQPVQMYVKQAIPEQEKHFTELKPVASELAGGFDFQSSDRGMSGNMNGGMKDKMDGAMDKNPMNRPGADSTGSAANGPEEDNGQ